MSMPAFDTYKAVQVLKGAGFVEAQATAVVSTILDATGEDIAALREDVASLPTKADLEQALKPYATKEDLAKLETRIIKYLVMTLPRLDS